MVNVIAMLNQPDSGDKVAGDKVAKELREGLVQESYRPHPIL
jgi:hypothetical protein